MCDCICVNIYTHICIFIVIYMYLNINWKGQRTSANTANNSGQGKKKITPDVYYNISTLIS